MKCEAEYEIIFARLQTPGILDDSGTMNAEYINFEFPGLYGSHVDNLLGNTISLAHNRKQNSDVMF